MRTIVFQHLYGDVYGYLKEDTYHNEITFPQNFVPTPGIRYKNLSVQYTSTGLFKYNDKIYSVNRAYHPDFDNKGNRVDKIASIEDENKFLYNNKDKNKKMDNPFSVLSSLKL